MNNVDTIIRFNLALASLDVLVDYLKDRRYKAMAIKQRNELEKLYHLVLQDKAKPKGGKK